MKKTFIIQSFCLLIFSGCAGFQDVMQHPYAMEAPLIRQYAETAAEYENRGDLPMALSYWEIIYGLTPDKEPPLKNIDRLKKAISEQTDAQLKKGRMLLMQKKQTAAQEAFLAALRLSPDNRPALEYIREMNGDDTITYKVVSGDTFERISETIYDTPEMAFLIRSASKEHQTENALPLPGDVLTLPYIEKQYLTEPEKSKETIDLIEQKMAEAIKRAEASFQKGNYEEVLSITEPLLEDDSESIEAQQLTVDAIYQLGKKYKEQNDLPASLTMFKKLAPDYKDVQQQITDLDIMIKEASDVHYRLGLKHFINEDLKRAIMEWEKALDLNPDNEKAKKDIKDARDLMEKLRKLD